MEAKQIHSVETAMEKAIFHPVRGQVIFFEGKKRGVCFGKDRSNFGHCFDDGRRFWFSTKEIWIATASEQQGIIHCEL